MAEFRTTADYCRVRIGELFRRELPGSRLLEIPEGGVVYRSGESDATFYFIECGQIQLLLPAPAGRDILMATRNAGDFFGESCLSGELTRPETAVATRDTVVRAMSRHSFLSCARNESRLEDVIRHLALCLAEGRRALALLSLGNVLGAAAAGPETGQVLPLNEGESS